MSLLQAGEHRRLDLSRRETSVQASIMRPVITLEPSYTPTAAVSSYNNPSASG